jgi:hypothetical protein
MEAKLSRYKDPRTKEDEYASPDDIDAIKRYLVAWKFYWDGPVDSEGEPVYDRQTWFLSDNRYGWMNTLTDDQLLTLSESYPPEEVPKLERVHE